jgi:hypothetical protein
VLQAYDRDPTFDIDPIDDGVDDLSWSLPMAPQSIVDEINEQGALLDAPVGAEYDEEMGRVFICEVVPRVEVVGGVGFHVDEAPVRRICSIDDAHPFSAAIGLLKIQPHLAARPQQVYENHDANQKREAKRQSDDHRAQFTSVNALKFRGGARYWSGMENDLAANRKARRIREALRRRGG